MPLGMEPGGRARPRRHCVRWGSSSPHLDFWATVCKTVRPMLSDRCLSCPVCLSVTVGWIKVIVGTKVGLRPGHIVLDGDPAPPKGAEAAPNFRPMSVVAKRMDRSRCHLVWSLEVGLGPGDIVLDGDPALPIGKGHSSPLFSACLLR